MAFLPTLILGIVGAIAFGITSLILGVLNVAKHVSKSLDGKTLTMPSIPKVTITTDQGKTTIQTSATTHCKTCGGPVTKKSCKFCDFCGTKLG